MRVPAAVALVCLLATAACGEDGTAAGPADRAAEPELSTSTATPTTAADGPVRWGGVLGLGSWEGARVASDDGREILVVFVGSREYNPDDRCSVDYRVVAAEADDEVRVRIGAVENPPLPEGFGCTMEGHRRHLRVRLTEPLGDRRLVEAQFDRVQAVLRAPLADVGWVPDGWEASPEGPSFRSVPAPPMTEAEKERAVAAGADGLYEGIHWARHWAPERKSILTDRCTPTEAGLTLTEGPPAFAQAADAPGAQHHDVNGHRATYVHERQGDDDETARLSWVAGGRGYLVESSPGCQGDTLSPVEEMLRFARAVRPGK